MVNKPVIRPNFWGARLTSAIIVSLSGRVLKVQKIVFSRVSWLLWRRLAWWHDRGGCLLKSAIRCMIDLRFLEQILRNPQLTWRLFFVGMNWAAKVKKPQEFIITRDLRTSSFQKKYTTWRRRWELVKAMVNVAECVSNHESDFGQLWMLDKILCNGGGPYSVASRVVTPVAPL